MAIEYTVLMKSENLTNEILKHKINEMGYTRYNEEILSRGISISLVSEIGLYISLIDAGKYPYNSWETDLDDREFEFQRSLGFRFDKEYEDHEKRNNFMLTIIFDMMLFLEEEALFIGPGSGELCMFKKDARILLNNEDGIWNEKTFKQAIEDKKIEYVI